MTVTKSDRGRATSAPPPASLRGLARRASDNPYHPRVQPQATFDTRCECVGPWAKCQPSLPIRYLVYDSFELPCPFTVRSSMSGASQAPHGTKSRASHPQVALMTLYPAMPFIRWSYIPGVDLTPFTTPRRHDPVGRIHPAGRRQLSRCT